MARSEKAGQDLKRFVYSSKEKYPILELEAGKGVGGGREMAGQRSAFSPC